MTAPIAIGSCTQGPGPMGLDLLGATPASPTGGPTANGSPATASVNPTAMMFAGMLARIVSVQAAAEAKTPSEPGAMVQAALASLNAAIADDLPIADTGTPAIRALVELVARQGDAASSVTPLAGPASTVNGTTQSLGAAAVIAPPVATITTTPAATTRPTREGVKTPDEDTQAARTDTDAENANSTAARANAFGTHAPAAVDPAAVVREAGALDPAFRARLDRVIERMQSEFGYKVTIVETMRSQARQDVLFEQGRSAPGPVVTWTRASRHADGLAADLMIDGGYDNPVAFERLQRIANEEGLHTLGARDPGHLELRIPQAGGFTAKIATAVPGNTTLRAPAGVIPSQEAVREPAENILMAGNDAMPRIARIAQVAEVAVSAGVARVASVARAAMPGIAAPRVRDGMPSASDGTRGTGTNGPLKVPLGVPLAVTHDGPSNAAPTAPTAQTAPAGQTAPAVQTAPTPSVIAPTVDSRVATGAPVAASGQPLAASKGDRPSATGAELPAVAVQPGSAAAKSSSRDRGLETGPRTPRSAADTVPPASDAPAVPISQPTRGAAGLAPASAVAGPDQGARVNQIDALHEQAVAQPVSSMVLDVDDGSGGTDRIRVEVRGNNVASTIDVHGRQAASELSARTGELTRALESHGLASDGVRVRAVAPPASADALRAATGGESAAPRGIAGALATDTSNPSRNERDTPREPRAGLKQEEQDSHRQRSRREREDHQP